MLKLKLGIADSDKVYLDRLTRLLSRKYKNQVETYSFSDGKSISESIRSNRINVLAASPNIEIDQSKIADFCMFAYLVDVKSIAEYKNQKAICKYQKVDQIYKQVLGLYSEKLADKVRYKNSGVEKSSISLFVSGYERAGATTMAAAYATRLAGLGKKTLFLNLKQFGSSEKIFSAPGEYTFTDAIFAVKSKKANITLKLESIVKQSNSGVFFYDSCKNVLDYTEVKADELRMLLDEIRSSFGYEHIVIVSDFYFSDKTIFLMEYADEIILVSDSNTISGPQMIKRKEAIINIEKRKSISITDKMRIILNKTKYLNTIRSEIPVIATQAELKTAGQAELVKELSESGIFDKLTMKQEAVK